MREIRQSGSEGGEPQPNAASLPLSKRWSPKRVAAKPGSHRRQGGGEPRKIVQENHPPSGDGSYEEVVAKSSRSNAR